MAARTRRVGQFFGGDSIDVLFCVNDRSPWVTCHLSVTDARVGLNAYDLAGGRSALPFRYVSLDS